MADRSRTPISVRTPMLAWSSAEPAASDLFASHAQQNAPDHPDFTARQAIWLEYRDGIISLAEARRRSAAIGAPLTLSSRLNETPRREPGAPKKAKPACPRHTRPTPNESRQYAPAMATTAARDDRVTPNAKAFLQVLRARCGKGRETTITKGTAANIMARSTRTIRRYLDDLVRCGYIETRIRTTDNGMHIGLVIVVTELAAPFFESAKGLARWLAETPGAILRPFEAVVAGFQGRTQMSSKNQTAISSSHVSADTSRKAAREELMKTKRAKFAPFGR